MLEEAGLAERVVRGYAATQVHGTGGDDTRPSKRHSSSDASRPALRRPRPAIRAGPHPEHLGSATCCDPAGLLCASRLRAARLGTCPARIRGRDGDTRHACAAWTRRPDRDLMEDRVMLLRPRVAANHGCAMRAIAGWCLWFLALSGALSIGCAMQTHNGGALVLADGASGPMSSPAYANAFEQWNVFSTRTSSSPVTFRLQAETKFGWEVCVTGGCEALGYWDPDKALLLRTDPSRYPIWEGVGQLPGGCDIEYKYLMRPRGRSEGARWENCANRIIRTSTIEKAILLVTDPDKISQQELSRQEMVTSQYFKEWTTLAAPFSSTLIFNTARPAHHFKELLEDEAFQRPCALVFCRDSGTEIFVRDYETPQIGGGEQGAAEPLLDTRPELPGHQKELQYPNQEGWRVGSDVNSLD